MNTTRIKICGITRLDDALSVEKAGADAIGFVFIDKSKRAIGIPDAVGIAAQLGPFTQRVGLFLDTPAAQVEQALATLPGLLPQFHGRETPEYCDAFGRPYIKAIGVAGGVPDVAELQEYRHCQGFLFDSNAPGELGGTGHTFDWYKLQAYLADNVLPASLILAGGLTANNVGEAISTVKPYAVDVSSAVEFGPGSKDHELVHAFIAAVRQHRV